MVLEENEVTDGRKDGQQFLPRSIMEFLTPPEQSSLDSSDVNAQSTPLSKSRHRSLWSLQITITLTDFIYIIGKLNVTLNV